MSYNAIGNVIITDSSRIATCGLARYDKEKEVTSLDENPKIKENSGSEVLGVIANDSITSFGKKKSFEVDATDKTPEIILKRIQDIMNNQESGDVVDWLKLIEEKNEMNKFFDY